LREITADYIKKTSEELFEKIYDEELEQQDMD
jgi:ribosomal protein S17E